MGHFFDGTKKLAKESHFKTRKIFEAPHISLSNNTVNKNQEGIDNICCSILVYFRHREGHNLDELIIHRNVA